MEASKLAEWVDSGLQVSTEDLETDPRVMAEYRADDLLVQIGELRWQKGKKFNKAIWWLWNLYVNWDRFGVELRYLQPSEVAPVAYVIEDLREYLELGQNRLEVHLRFTASVWHHTKDKQMKRVGYRMLSDHQTVDKLISRTIEVE